MRAPAAAVRADRAGSGGHPGRNAPPGSGAASSAPCSGRTSISTAALIHVRRSFDDKAGVVDPKTRAGRRDVPIVAALDDILRAWHAAGNGDGFVFPGRSSDRPFNPTNVYRKAANAWRRAALEGFVPHEGRHSAASLMIASGANPLAVKAVVGHANIDTTFDIYGHLLAGHQLELRALVDAFIARDEG